MYSTNECISGRIIRMLFHVTYKLYLISNQLFVIVFVCIVLQYNTIQYNTM